MSRPLIWSLGAAFAVLILVGSPTCAWAQAEEQEPNLGGTYSLEGGSSVGGTYKGKVVITRKGDTYLLAWDADGTKYNGIGIRTKGKGEGDTLSVCYKYGGDVAVIAYRVVRGEKGPQLVGRWSYLPGDGRTFKETLTYTSK